EEQDGEQQADRPAPAADKDRQPSQQKNQRQVGEERKPQDHRGQVQEGAKADEGETNAWLAGCRPARPPHLPPGQEGADEGDEETVGVVIVFKPDPGEVNALQGEQGSQEEACHRWEEKAECSETGTSLAGKAWAGSLPQGKRARFQQGNASGHPF